MQFVNFISVIKAFATCNGSNQARKVDTKKKKKKKKRVKRVKKVAAGEKSFGFYE